MSVLYRGRGPKVFISYGFGNTLAVPLAHLLEGQGFQVTLIDRQTLVGEQDLHIALRQRIRAAEVLIPILDEKANRSVHVDAEIQTAKEFNIPLVPIVQSEDGLHESIRQIPYTSEPGPILSKMTADVIASKILDWYPRIPLDADQPYQFAETALQTLLQRNETVRTIRILLDIDDVTGAVRRGASAAIAKLTASQPEIRSIVEQQLGRNIDTIIATLNGVEVALINFGKAVTDSMQNYGVESLSRQIAPWQRLLRLLTSDQWHVIFGTVPPSHCPELWKTDGTRIESALATWKEFEHDNSVHQSTFISWSLSYPAGYSRPVTRGGWIRMKLVDPEGGTHFIYLPRVDRIAHAIESKTPPERFLEGYEWADFVIPQILAGLGRDSVRRRANDPLELIYWRMSDFETRGG